MKTEEVRNALLALVEADTSAWTAQRELSTIVQKLTDARTLLSDVLLAESKQPDPCLTLWQWTHLEQAEKPLYSGQYGANSYTDVMPREMSSDLVPMWENAWINVDASYDDKSETWKNHETARRVARAQAILAFGAEFIIK